MRFILLSILACFCFAADPAPEKVKLPAEAQKIVDDHDAQVAAAKRACEAACAKADAEAVKKLEPVMIKITKSGDLASANAVKSKVDAYKTKPANNDDLLGEGEAEFQTALIGKWKFSFSTRDGTITVDKKFAVSLSDGNIGTLNPEKNQATISWGNGTKWVITSKSGQFFVSASDGASALTKF